MLAFEKKQQTKRKLFAVSFFEISHEFGDFVFVFVLGRELFFTREDQFNIS